MEFLRLELGKCICQTSNSDIRKQSYAKNRFSTIHFSPSSCISQTIALNSQKSSLASMGKQYVTVIDYCNGVIDYKEKLFENF
ncbi:hypothetical protein Lal_00043599 [Lupinus albus]|nr:hypothetical protein Lal_00043599 [Lupinus albus]